LNHKRTKGDEINKSDSTYSASQKHKVGFSRKKTIKEFVRNYLPISIGFYPILTCETLSEFRFLTTKNQFSPYFRRKALKGHHHLESGNA
jgi:hypothetical protein